MQTSPIALLVSLASFSSICSDAFHVDSTRVATRVGAMRIHPLSGVNLKKDSDDGGGDSFDIEAARKKLESIVGGRNDGEVNFEDQPTISRLRSENQTISVHDMSLPDAPLLTSIERERRQAEIGILQRLEYGDEPLSDLWTLWFQERGAEAAAHLVRADQLFSHPRTWDQAEGVLRDLIAKYGVHWAEPVNRLATLYYMQGKLKESASLCQTVLAIKPWHFGALSGIVFVFGGMHDADEARHWAVRRLPTFAPIGSNKRREQWVEMAVRKAEDSLEAAERRLQHSFGGKDGHIVDGSIRYYNELDEKDSWQ